MNAIVDPPVFRFGRRALALLVLVLVLHALVLAWVASDLGQLVVDTTTPSSLAVVILPPAAPPVSRPAPPARRVAPRPHVVSAAPAPAPVIEPVNLPEPAPAPPPVVEPVVPDHGAGGDGESVSGPADRDAAPMPTLPLPSSGRLVYHLTHSNYPGSVARTVVEWSIDEAGRRYETRLQAAVGGIALVSSISVGRIDAGGFMPERYSQRTTTRAETAVNFDWAGARVTYSASRAENPLVAGMQDPLSIQFQVPVLAQRAGERLHAGQRLPLEVARPSKVDRVEFVVGGKESIKTTAGQTVAVFKLEALRHGVAEQGWEFWLAPDLYWLPVRIRLTDRRGQVWDNVLAALPGTPEPASPSPQNLYHGS